MAIGGFTAGRSVGAFKSSFFDTDAVIRGMDRAARKALSKFGAFVRTRARSSIKARKKVSEPGSPPSSRTGLLRDFVYFAYDAEAKSVVIGPAKLSKPGQTPEVLEYGGSMAAPPGGVIYVTRDPGRDASGKFVSSGKKRIKLRGNLQYKARPFMNPAYAQELPKLLGFFKDAAY